MTRLSTRRLATAAIALAIALPGCTPAAGAPMQSAEPADLPTASAPAPTRTGAAEVPTLPPTVEAAPDGRDWRPTPPPAISAPLGLTVDLYRDGSFVSQATKDFCVPGAIATMMNLIDEAGVLPHPDQATLNQVARRLSTDRLVGAGSEPEGWAGALNTFGYGPYVVRSVPTRDAALETAAKAIRATGRPVGLLVWRGAHAWVMSGFEGEADRRTPGSLEVTAVYLQDPWHPRVSSIWGPGQSPNTRIEAAALAADYLPWRRPTARYPEKDGQYVLILPIVEAFSETAERAH